MTVEYETKNGKVYVSSEYQSNLPGLARNLGGHWESLSKQWVFDERDFDDVKDLYLEIYGEFGDESTEKVDLVIEFTSEYSECKGPICLHGVEIARAFSKKSNVKKPNNVIVRQGEFFAGGSYKNWYTAAETGTIVEVRDIPINLARHIVDNHHKTLKVQIIGDDTKSVIALQKEKEKLLKRIKEIDLLLDENFNVDPEFSDEN